MILYLFIISCISISYFITMSVMMVVVSLLSKTSFRPVDCSSESMIIYNIIIDIFVIFNLFVISWVSIGNFITVSVMMVSIMFLNESQTIIILVSFMSIISPVTSRKTKSIISNNLVLFISQFTFNLFIISSICI